MMRRRPRHFLFFSAKFCTISLLYNTQKWVKKKEIYQSLSPKISFTTYKSPFSLPTNSETRPRRLRSHRLSPTLKAELCCSNANKSPTFAVKRRTFTMPVLYCFSGYACWRVAVCRSEISAAALRQQESSQPIADAKIKH